jgi:hypothetical protein
MITAAPAFLRFSRDKRGYEHFYLVQSTTNRRGKTRTRILFWFRTPPGVKVGRTPFSDDVQRAIEAQNPGVVFDWKRLISTPIPPPAPDVERWRERRRLEKAEKAARRALLAADGEPEDEGEAANADASAETNGAEPALETASVEASSGDGSEPAEAAAAEPGAPAQAAGSPDPGAARSGRRRRRRRRGGHRNPGSETPPANGNPPSSNPED